ncbi:hypothetical protein QQ045_005870 [Rhodiola kirilowii]
MATRKLCRPRTQPDLLATNGYVSCSYENRPQPTKLLLNVTMLWSIGPVHVVMSMDSTVADLISYAVRQYVKEGRRPGLPTTDPCAFDLHYSQFCLECLDIEEKLVNVWSRNFLLCPKKDSIECSGAEQAPGPWVRFMDLLL